MQKGCTAPVLAGAAALALCMGIGRFAMTPMLPAMVAEGAISVSGGGLLATLHFAGYLAGALTAVWIGPHARFLFPASIASILLATLAMGSTESTLVWGIARILAGVASAWILVIVSRFILASVPEQSRTSGQGVVFSGVGAGIMMAGTGSLLFGYMELSGSSGWLLLGTLCAGLSVLAIVCARRVISNAAPSVSTAPEMRSSLEWRAMLAYGVAGLGYVVPATYLPLMAQQLVQSPQLSGLAWPVFGLAAAISTIAAARIFERWGNRAVWAGAQAIMAAGVVLPVMFDNLAAIILAGLCVGGTFMVVTMAGVREAYLIAVPSDVVRHIAALTASFAVGQMVGPVIAGYAFEYTGSFAGPLIVAAVLLAATAVLVRRSPVSPVG
jgi:predicted MFS family arabinose efflux permease